MNILKKYLTIMLLLGLTCPATACNSSSSSEDEVPPHLKPENPEEPVRDYYPKTDGATRLVTYNVGIFNKYIKDDYQLIADMMKEIDADAICMNELDNNTNRTRHVYQLKHFASLMGSWDFEYGAAMPYDGGEYGDAVLSKHPIIETRSYRLPCAASQPGEDRSLCVIRVEIDGKDLYVASTHLDHLSGDASRLVQANEIRRIRDTELDGDLILAGDLNAIPSSNVIATMTAFLTNVGTIDQYTFPSENPTRKIDYILYAPIGHFSVQNCTVVSRSDQQVDGVDASDHRPVVADIRFQTEEDLPENQE